MHKKDETWVQKTYKATSQRFKMDSEDGNGGNQQ